MAEKTEKNRLLPVIGGFKLLKAALLFAAAYGLRKLRLAPDSEAALANFIRSIRVDPDNRYAHQFLAKATGIKVDKLHELGIATFGYAVLFSVEGTGLLLRKTWAEYFTIITTGLFLPLEIYELLFRPEHKAVKTAVFVFNLIVVAYLIFNLIRTRRREAARGFPVPTPSTAASSPPPAGTSTARPA